MYHVNDDVFSRPLKLHPSMDDFLSEYGSSEALLESFNVYRKCDALFPCLVMGGEVRSCHMLFLNIRELDKGNLMMNMIGSFIAPLSQILSSRATLANNQWFN